MPGSEVTVAELLKARGYHTVHIGKWHLGGTPENPEMRPNAQGFDESLYMESGLYLPQDSPDVVNSKQDFDPLDRFFWPNMRFGVSYNNGKWFEPAKYLTDYFTDEAVTDHPQQPQPAVLPVPGALGRAHAVAGQQGRLRRLSAAFPTTGAASTRPWCARSTAASGRVLQALRDDGLDDNTIVGLHQRQRRAGLHRPARGQPAVPRLEADAVRRRPARALHGQMAGPHTGGQPLSGADVQHRHPAHAGRGRRRQRPDRPGHGRRQPAALPGQGRQAAAGARRCSGATAPTGRCRTRAGS